LCTRRLAEAPSLAAAVTVARRLAKLLRRTSEKPEPLGEVLAAAKTTPLARLAANLERDQAALKLPWTTSPVEGQVNRLKTIKRSMYGRAGFQLLRQRVLQAAWSPVSTQSVGEPLSGRAETSLSGFDSSRSAKPHYGKRRLNRAWYPLSQRVQRLSTAKGSAENADIGAEESPKRGSPSEEFPGPTAWEEVRSLREQHWASRPSPLPTASRRARTVEPRSQAPGQVPELRIL
jgi:hypothetical protein